MPPKYGGGPSCHRCHKTVYQNELRRDPAGCGDYHKSCYVCFTCNKSLDSTKICTHEGEIYCKACYGAQFGAKGYGYGAGAGALTRTQ